MGRSTRNGCLRPAVGVALIRIEGLQQPRTAGKPEGARYLVGIALIRREGLRQEQAIEQVAVDIRPSDCPDLHGGIETAALG